MWTVGGWIHLGGSSCPGHGKWGSQGSPERLKTNSCAAEQRGHPGGCQRRPPPVTLGLWAGGAGAGRLIVTLGGRQTRAPPPAPAQHPLGPSFMSASARHVGDVEGHRSTCSVGLCDAPVLTRTWAGCREELGL